MLFVVLVKNIVDIARAVVWGYGDYKRIRCVVKGASTCEREINAVIGMSDFPSSIERVIASEHRTFR